MLVRDGYDTLQVVGEVKREPGRHVATYLTYTNGVEEECPAGDDVEIVRLTDGQRDALARIADGGVYRARRAGGR